VTAPRDLAATSLPRAARGAVAVLAGALAVALGAQLAVPLPGTPVPITFQVPVVLIAGGVLGARLGAISMAVYLAAGALGLPVFAPGGTPGVARLFGPTGGYLLAFPAAAAAVGLLLAGRRSWFAIAVALLAGLALIHLGGVAQLAAVGGDWRAALNAGSMPFLPGDLIKLLLAALVIRRLAP
jgi:biotin transport system substrate-specific component